jgi:Big-like domain-containing protein
MDASTINATNITLRQTTTGAQLLGTVSYDATTHIATYNPPENIEAPLSYTVTVDKSVTDSAGLALGTDYQFAFTTGDGTAPTITSRNPSSGAKGVTVASPIKVTFSEDMDPRFVLASVGGFTVTLNGSQVAGTASYDSATHTASYQPTQLLHDNTMYTVNLASWVTDVTGMQIGTPQQWTFTTVDNTPPTALITSPPRGNNDIQPNAVVIVRFSEAMDPATINNATLILRNTTAGANVDGTIIMSELNSVATLTPSAPLVAGSAYTTTVTVGAKDVAGNALRNEETSNFFTTSTPDTIRPEVSTTTPADETTGVATNGVVRARFSENVSGVSSSSFILKKTATGELVTGTVTYDGSFTEGTFTPSGVLAPNTSYTATLTTAIQDFAGNLLVPKTFTFTTAP